MLQGSTHSQPSGPTVSEQAQWAIFSASDRREGGNAVRWAAHEELLYCVVYILYEQMPCGSGDIKAHQGSSASSEMQRCETLCWSRNCGAESRQALILWL